MNFVAKRFQSHAMLRPKTPPAQKSGDIFSDGWITKLASRSVISVRGRDSTTILQNLATTNLELFFKDARKAASYTGFLTVKGRLQYDAIIAKPKLASQTTEDLEYWIDIGEQDAEPFMKHMKRYSMRKNVKTEDISHIIKPFAVQTLPGLEATEIEGNFFETFQD